MTAKEMTCCMYHQFGIKGENKCSECRFQRKGRKEQFCTKLDKLLVIEDNAKACGAFEPKAERF